MPRPAKRGFCKSLIYEGMLALSNAANAGASQSIAISNTPTSLGVLSLRYNGVPGGITPDSSGVLAIDTTNFNAPVDLGRLGSVYLGSTLGGTNSASLLSAAPDATYRLGGGAGTLVLDAPGAGVLTGACAVVVGKGGPGGNYAGNIVLADANSYGGTTTVNRGSVLTGYAQASGGGSPFGSSSCDVVLNAGTLAFNYNGALTPRDPVSKGMLKYTGSSALLLTAPTPPTNVQMTFSSLVRGDGTNPAVLKIGGTNKLGTNEVVKVTGGVPTAYGIVAPYMVHTVGTGAGDFLTYDDVGFRVATNYTAYTGTGVYAPATNEISNITGFCTVTSGAPYAVRFGDVNITLAINSKLSIGSGGMLWYANGARTLSAGNANSIVDFGSQEGIIHVSGGSSLSINTALAGTKGFTKSGPGGLVVNGIASCTNLTGRLAILEGFMTHSTSGWNFTNRFPGITEVLLDGGSLDCNNQPVTYPAGVPLTIGPNGGTININSSGGSILSLNGTVQGTGLLRVIGPAGTITFSGTNTYSGGTYVQTRIIVAAGSSLGTGPVYINADPTYNNITFNGGSNISATAQLAMAAGSVVYMVDTAVPHWVGSLLGAGNLVLGPSAGSAITTLTVGGDNTSTPFGGVIADRTVTGRGALAKIGSGTLTLAGTNTYTGPTAISNGTLLVNGRLAAASSVNVVAGGALGGAGTVAGVVTNAGALVPGPAGIGSAGTLTTSNLTLLAGSTCRFDLGAPTATNDLVVINGPLTLAGTIAIDRLPGMKVGTYTLMTYTGAKSGSVALQLPTGYSGKVSYDETTTPKQVKLTILSGTLLLFR